MRDRDHAALAHGGWHDRLHPRTWNVWVRAIGAVVTTGVLALLYLNQVAGVATANRQLSALQSKHAHLQNEDARLRVRLGTVTSPAWIDQRARAMGLAPAAPGTIRYLFAASVRSATGG